ncbi:MAG: hypothetical protein V3V82_08440 [Acidimicrobiia bacterium]
MHPVDRTYRGGFKSTSIEQALVAAEAQVAAGHGLAGTRFWAAVAEVKADDGLVESYANRIATIDQAAFAQWALLTMPKGLGTTLAFLGTATGLVLIGVSYPLDGLAAVVAFYLGFGALLTSTHALAHLIVGQILGIRFTGWFSASLTRPQPGVKIDYESYLRTPAIRRAWMHASGAIVTKIIPFALVGAAIAAGLPTWAVLGLVVIGIVTIVTDVLWSTTGSDWMKYRREMKFAQTS